MKKSYILMVLCLWASIWADPFLGEVRAFGNNFCPKGWVKASGQLLPINQNQALFALLGTMYGGDGRVNFALPNLQNRTPISAGQDYISGFSVTQGEQSGSETHTLTLNELPNHSHNVNVLNGSTQSVRIAVADSAANSTSPVGAAIVKNSSSLVSDTSQNSKMVIPAKTTINVQGSTVGGSQAFNSRSPYIVYTYCIATQGVFPSQN